MLLIPNALCCSLYKRNCVCAVTNFFLPAKTFSPTSASNAQAQLHFRNDQQRAFEISNISNWVSFKISFSKISSKRPMILVVMLVPSIMKTQPYHEFYHQKFWNSMLMNTHLQEGWIRLSAQISWTQRFFPWRNSKFTTGIIGYDLIDVESITGLLFCPRHIWVQNQRY